MASNTQFRLKYVYIFISKEFLEIKTTPRRKATLYPEIPSCGVGVGTFFTTMTSMQFDRVSP